MFTKPLRGTQLNRDHPLARGLVGCWLFNEGCGDKAYDLSGCGNHGKLENMAFPPTATSGWNPGKDGVGLMFNGSSNYVNCGNDASLNITDAITIEVWVKPAALSAGFILSNYDDANNRWDLAMISTYFVMTFGNGTTYKAGKYTLTPIVGQWYHLAATYEAGGQVKLFVNAVEGELSETLSGALSIVSADLLLASRAGSFFFNGTIDEVRIYNRALSAEEIKWLYREQYAMFEPDDLGILSGVRRPYYVSSNLAAMEMLR